MHIFLDEEHPCVLINDSYSTQRQEQITTSETVKCFCNEELTIALHFCIT